MSAGLAGGTALQVETYVPLRSKVGEAPRATARPGGIERSGEAMRKVLARGRPLSKMEAAIAVVAVLIPGGALGVWLAARGSPTPVHQLARDRETPPVASPSETFSAPRPPCVPGDPLCSAGSFVWQAKRAPDAMSWADAKAYCAKLSLAGGSWRLPAKDELMALYNANAAGTREPEWFWSSTPVAGSPGVAWNVNFVNGRVGTNGVSDTGQVRCVR